MREPLITGWYPTGIMLDGGACIVLYLKNIYRIQAHAAEIISDGSEQEEEMPTYEYICTKCGHEFEVFQTMSEEPVKDCPQCQGEVRRKISGGMFCVKGKELDKIKDKGLALDHFATGGPPPPGY